ncbi:hypothetical protein DFJ74DRAFT_696009 [Hyaloraphidium curvatum]|nr:hypothetical protein DFJ74DRAFT_696009 [Hyaloraphidium curvatum]
MASIGAQPLASRVCIVTGAGSMEGIGRAVVLAFCSAGASVVYAADLRSPDGFSSLVAETKRFAGTRVETVLMDAASEADVKALCERAVAEHGRLDVFHANAGVASEEYLLEQVTPEDFMRTLRVNLLSGVLAAKHGAAAMRVTGKDKPEPGGSLIMTASVAGLGSLGYKGSAPAYGAAKAGVINLVKSLAWPLGRSGIRINAVNPGVIRTSLNATAFAAAARRGELPGVATLNALSRFGLPAEIAQAVLFLATDASSYVTGQAVSVDGGWSASLPVGPQPGASRHKM